MSRDPEPWGGDVRLPRPLRRLLRRRDPEDTPEKRAEGRRRPSAPERGVLENADKAAGGAFIVQDPPRSRGRFD